MATTPKSGPDITLPWDLKAFDTQNPVKKKPATPEELRAAGVPVKTDGTLPRGVEDGFLDCGVD